MIKYFGGGCALTLLLILLCTGVVAGDGIDSSGNQLVKPLLHATISQGFGCTSVTLEPFNPSCPSKHWHSGIDLVAPFGTPVFAIASGTATVINDKSGFGLHIIIDHGGGITSLYGHLIRVDVANGEDVVSGEVIGAVGSTGNSTGPHLHFEIRRGGVPENPMEDLPLP